MSDIETLEAAIRTVFGDVRELHASAVRRDGANRSWYVTLEGRRIVAKTPERRGGLTISPALEYELLLVAADSGIAPRPLGFDSVTEILFVEFVAGCGVLERSAALRPDTVAVLGETLRKLHALEAPAALRAFDPSAFAAAYSASGGEAVLRLADELEGLSARFSRVIAGRQVCHNDLHAGNILSGERLWLIDFEYAVQASPIVDLASFAAFHDLGERAAMDLARACLGEEPPFSAAELAGVVRMQHILGELWEIARSDNNGPPELIRARQTE